MPKDRLKAIEENVQLIRERMVEKTPTHFDMRHLITAFFGALFFGFTAVLNRLLFDFSLALNTRDLILLTIATWILLTVEIYFVGYTRIQHPEKRPFGQFWAKRFFSYYFIALFTSFVLLSLYGVWKFIPVPSDAIKLVVTVSFPAAIGAAVSDLLGKY